ncbi:nicotinate-nucleotide pyrophosphorylase (carboxylating) [Leadbetterella byssophila DSM 17132]|uniref:Probable nicotinate-nucleotide pyrophosphorylase [carboxylating] n=1 Tax=Leadbetterella byssophila (strain DSM 17132 / JCM 16389 / KACC 11308 / NBRC 106382 / 4M15) TaxID=649349 RepID=E4RZR9_LEAB4|nr:carboxylating nicotinate-nucleotide diphosphorylase [Leadbetterella byssophila]ADQ18312.1 nicotinate-nucleotide pyrophosphorylase (carboxylating) [Leadbetterella byssophila DSM 17132]
MMINQEDLLKFINLALEEDVREGDHTSLSTVPADAIGKAKLLVKDTGILAGVELAELIFKTVDPRLKVEVLLKDGSPIKPGDIALYVEGPDRSILTAERLVLNCMQRMSGIATVTKSIVDRLEGTNCKVLDTRKTTPGIRLLEKWAVQIGGGVNHRFGLFDMILIKDNHVDYAGGIKEALQAAQNYVKEKGLKLDIEIEVRNLDELKQVLEVGGVVRIMLDNFNYGQIREALQIIDGRFPVEASGGITPENVREYAETGVDYVSMGYLTHSVKSLDLSLKAIK